MYESGDMWNWIIECYDEGSLTIEELERVMTDEKEAMKLWEDFSKDSRDFIVIDEVRSEVHSFLEYIKKRERNEC